MKSSIAFILTAALSSAAFAQQVPRTYTPPPQENAPPAQGTATQQKAPSSAQTAQLGAIFDQLNTSHTGKLTKAEAQAQPTVAANFDAADTNHDGVLTKDEFLAAFKPAQ
jgi:hypothetical protein